MKAPAGECPVTVFNLDTRDGSSSIVNYDVEFGAAMNAPESGRESIGIRQCGLSHLAWANECHGRKEGEMGLQSLKCETVDYHEIPQHNSRTSGKCSSQCTSSSQNSATSARGAMLRSWHMYTSLLASGAFLVVFASGKTASDTDGELHASFRLSASGEELLLTRPDGSVADLLLFAQQHEDVSYGLAQAVDTVVAVTDGSEALFTILQSRTGSGRDSTTGHGKP